MRRRTFGRTVASALGGSVLAGSAVADESGDGDDAPASESAKYGLGDGIESTTGLNVRAGPGLDEDVKFAVPEGSEGWIVSTAIPDENSEYVFYRIKWDRHPIGWSVQRYLEPGENAYRNAFEYKEILETGGPVDVYADVGYQSERIGTAPPGNYATVFQGPLFTALGPQRWWWKVSVDGLVGWATERTLVTDAEGQPAEFEGNETVASTAYLSVREAPSIDAPRVDVVDPGDVGRVVPKRPVGTLGRTFFPADDYLWWHVDWEDGPTGWSVQLYLE